MIVVIVKFVFKEESLEQISAWLIENPDKGALYLALLYVIGIPLTLPSMPLLLIGSYASSHVYGFTSKSYSRLTPIRGRCAHVWLQPGFPTHRHDPSLPCWQVPLPQLYIVTLQQALKPSAREQSRMTTSLG